MTEDVEHVAMIQRLDPDHVDEYREAHEEIPDAVSEAMERGGVHTFRLFVHGDISVGYIEVEDFETFSKVYMADPECQDWEDRVGEYKRSGVDAEAGDLPLMDEIWTFEAE